MDSIEAFVAAMDFEAFQADDKTASAVIRKFEIIGEAAKHVPKEIWMLAWFCYLLASFLMADQALAQEWSQWRGANRDGIVADFPITQYRVADSPTWAHPAVLSKQLLIKDYSMLYLWGVE